jgi:ADP-ribosyl-[dinitrogen reductase] hydrolase
MERFVRWWKEGENSHTGRCFDIGVTTRTALQKYLDTGEPYSGDTDPYSAGNGSLMRHSPVAIAYHRNSGKAIEVARLQSRTTHAAAECEDYCVLFTELLLAAFAGSAQVESDLDREQVSSSGYVKHTYEAAVWAIATTSSFREALISAVNLGDDADTVGAVTGQLAGALYGYSAIPDEWSDVLIWREKIEALSDGLIAVSGR